MTQLSEIWYADFHDEESGETIRLQAHAPGKAGAVNGGIFMEWSTDGIFKLDVLSTEN